ncbi:hypothetical protein NUW54_g6534 [Trametes sanguinea]|uniref:Uncharacterized protein n=1 Tax=Trametes sanguinea TaxID=158606 RepID=A0ACC1PS26_9APHY|nr:hypothetical protein NUW54_g6534 [Trametes sanguinea]
MKVMIKDNLAFSKRLVNGAEGIVTRVIYEECGSRRFASVVYVRVPGAGKVCDDLEEDVVPIFPEPVSFAVDVCINGQASKVSVSRLQMPLIPAYAYTDYKSQGKSLKYAILDIESAFTLQGVYVMLSRVQSLQGVLILRPFSLVKLYSRLSQELRAELGRIDKLAELTAQRFDMATCREGRMPLNYTRGEFEADF